MTIVGMLSAIAIPLYEHQRRRSADSSMQDDLRKVASQLEIYFADASSYPPGISVSGSTVTVATGFTVTISPDNTMTLTNPARPGGTFTYCLIASRVSGATAGSQNWVWINDKDGLQPAGTSTCS